MTIEPELYTIISSDSYERFPPSNRRQTSREGVQDFLDHGIMTQDSIYQRYTERLIYTIVVAGVSLENAKLMFRQLQDPDISRDRFERVIAQKFGGTVSIDSIIILYEIFRWYAFFPFPSRNTESGTTSIDEDAFIRAICLLTRNPRAYLSPRFSCHTHNTSYGISGHCSQFSCMMHGTCGGYWGPYYGSLLTGRGKESLDSSRWLFRSLAVPNDIITGHETTILVPRFMMYQGPSYSDSESGYEDSGSDDNREQQTFVVEYEKERSIDIHDIAAECAPGWDDRITANPLREAYELVLPSLPAHPYDLADLHVPTAKLLSLLEVLQAVAVERPNSPGEQELFSGMINSVESLDSDGKIEWQAFNSLTLQHMELIADCLSDIFEIFKAPMNIEE